MLNAMVQVTASYAPTTAVKKLKAPRKHPPKLMNLCCISQWEGRMKLGIVPMKSV